VIRQKGVAVLN